MRYKVLISLVAFTFVANVVPKYLLVEVDDKDNGKHLHISAGSEIKFIGHSFRSDSESPGKPLNSDSTLSENNANKKKKVKNNNDKKGNAGKFKNVNINFYLAWHNLTKMARRIDLNKSR